MERRNVAYEEVTLNDEEIVEAIKEYMIFRHEERVVEGVELEFSSGKMTATFKTELALGARRSRSKAQKPASGAPEKTVEPGELKVENTETDPAELLQKVKEIQTGLTKNDIAKCAKYLWDKFDATELNQLDFDQLTAYLVYLKTFPG